MESATLRLNGTVLALKVAIAAVVLAVVVVLECHF
jgi:hypothetical protein